jgi:transcriptional regulator with XRE-family HTH domain
MTTRSREPGPFARRLSAMRWRARLSREELARLAAISADTVQSLEQGRVGNPGLRTLLRLARGLGVTVGELVGGLEAGDGPESGGNGLPVL